MDWSWVDTLVGFGLGFTAMLGWTVKAVHSTKPICTSCNHGYGKHDIDKGCVERILKGKWIECGCRNYTGPRPS